MDSHNLHAIISDSRSYADDIEKRLIDSGGEITKEIEAAISFHDYTTKQLEHNVDIVGMALDRLNVLIVHYQEQIESIQAILEGLKSIDLKLRANIEHALVLNNATEISGDIKRISIKKNPPKVDVWNEAVIPDDYKKIVVTSGVNKLQIREDLKSGKEIPGCRLIQDSSIKVSIAKPKIEGLK